MSSLGAGVGVFNMFIYSRMVARFGVKCMYLVGLTAAVPCFSLFPIINYLARSSIQVSGGLGVGVRVAVGLQGVMVVLMNSCYGASASKRSNYLWMLVCFSLDIHLHRRRCSKQSFYGSHEWVRPITGVRCACGRTHPSKYDVLVVDR